MNRNLKSSPILDVLASCSILAVGFFTCKTIAISWAVVSMTSFGTLHIEKKGINKEKETKGSCGS
jgi:hypothetical protein